jgi:hypothetical protein
VLLHELGHAIGFNHSPDSMAVMWANAATGDNVIRNLSIDDILGLQQSSAPYGTIQTRSRHRFTAAAPPPTNWNSEDETISDALLGAPAAVHSPLMDGRFFYLAAYTRASDRTLMWGRTNGFANWGSGLRAVASGITSHRPPAVAASNVIGQEVLAYADPVVDALMTRVNSAGVGWGSAVSVGYESRVPPALAFLPNRNVYVLAWAHIPSGFIRTMVSNDGGQSWRNMRQWGFRTFQSFGITCRPSDECVVAFAKGESHLGRLGYFHLGYDSTTESLNVGTFSSPDILADTYGASITTSSLSGRTQFGWRDRGLATVATSGGWGSSPGSLHNMAWLPISIHAAARIAYNASWNEYTLWSNHSMRYDPL